MCSGKAKEFGTWHCDDANFQRERVERACNWTRTVIGCTPGIALVRQIL